MSDSMYSIVVLGAQGVGKTALVQQYLTGKFQQSPPCPSSPYSLTSKQIGQNIMLDVLDVSYMSPNSPVMKRAMSQGSVFILVYSFTDANSFIALKDLYNNIISVRYGEHVPIHVVGNKVDLVSKVLPPSPALEDWLMHTWIYGYFEVSCKSHEQVFAVFRTALESACAAQ